MPRKKTEILEKDPILDDDDTPETPKPQPEPVQPQTAADNVTVIEVRPAGGSKAEVMRRKLTNQPKVPVFIPLSGGEPIGSTHPVTLNGYRLNIKKGVPVMVPKQVADVLFESLRLTSEAINNYYRMNEGVSQAMRDKGLGRQE